MARRILAVLFALLVVAGSIFVFVTLRFNPASVDRDWHGMPIPPCFISSAGCYGHVLGTDDLGRDILARLAWGGLLSLTLSLVAVVFTLVLGIGAGAVARFGGTALRFVVERIAAALACFPSWAFIVVLLAIGTQMPGLGVPPLVLSALASLLFAPPIVRITIDGGSLRDTALALANQATRGWSQIIILLATVDAMGIGLAPPTPSWGTMLNLNAAGFAISVGWWIVAFPALALIGALVVIEVERRLLFAKPTGLEPDAALASAA